MGERVTFADLLKKAEEKRKAVNQPAIEVTETLTSPATQATPPTPPTPLTSPKNTISAILTNRNNLQPVSPERDFTKVPNSIIRDAVPQGLFIGKSKQIYDFLYLQTRGGIQPKRSVRVTKSNLMRGSDIGSERTLLKNLNHLKVIGLVKITGFEGQHGGNEYEVFLPEEEGQKTPNPPHPPHPRYPPQKVGRVPPAESGVGGVGQIFENKRVAGTLRLNTKTNTIDDEAFADFIENFDKISREFTGRGIAGIDGEKWRDLSELLILELRAAAKKTDRVSNVPAFLTEVLRRKLLNVPAAKKSKGKIDTVGRSETEDYEIKPLDEKGRETALMQLSEFSDDEFLEDFRKWYIEADWKWLMQNLKPVE